MRNQDVWQLSCSPSQLSASWSKNKLARSFTASGTFHNNRRVYVRFPSATTIPPMARRSSRPLHPRW
jgi:hypothetical protein